MLNRTSTWWVFAAVLIGFGLSIWLIISSDNPENIHDHRAVSSDLGGRPDRDGPRGKGGAATPDLGNDNPRVEPIDPLLATLPKPQQLSEAIQGQAREDWMDDVCEQLDEGSYQDDLTSLRWLLAELNNPELKIAEAAHASLMVRHDKRAIPYLEKRMASAPAFERKRLQELLDFLKTKSITESRFIKEQE